MSEDRGGCEGQRSLEHSPMLPKRIAAAEDSSFPNQSIQSKSPELPEQASRFLVGNARLSPDEYMNRTSELMKLKD